MTMKMFLWRLCPISQDSVTTEEESPMKEIGKLIERVLFEDAAWLVEIEGIFFLIFSL